MAPTLPTIFIELFNESLASAGLPAEWKSTVVFLLFTGCAGGKPDEFLPVGMVYLIVSVME